MEFLQSESGIPLLERIVSVVLAPLQFYNYTLKSKKQLTNFFVFRLVIGSVLVLTKFYNDVFYSNADIASIGGLTVEDLNRIERYLLETVDYQIYISSEEFQMYEQGISNHFALEQQQ